MPYTVVFHANETNLRLGENLLEITAEEPAIYDVENALLKVFYFGTPDQTAVKRTFHVTSSQYRKLAKEKYQGLIEFDNKIYLRGNLEVRLQNQTTNHTWHLFPSAGINKVFFDAEHISLGENEVVLTTDGSMEINDFEIKIIEQNS